MTGLYIKRENPDIYRVKIVLDPGGKRTPGATPRRRREYPATLPWRTEERTCSTIVA